MGCRLCWCAALLACASTKTVSSHTAARVTLSLSAPTLSAGQQATLTWHSDAAGSYLVTAKTDTAPPIVLSRGQVAANALVSTITDANALYSGVNHLTVSVLVEAAPIGSNSIDLSVTGGGAGGSSGGSSGGSTGGNGIFTISGTVSGLATEPLTAMLLTNNGGDPISVGVNGGFSFPAALAPGAAYAVAVAKPPLCPLYACTVSGGSGLANADVNDVAIACTATGLGVPPRIFFTDITSGPNAGGDGGNGAYVTLYGLDFGGSAGTVTIGGQAVIVKQWGKTGTTARGLDTVVVQLGPNVVAATPPVDQPLVLTTAAGIQSYTLDFAVSGTGNIYFVTGGATLNGDGTTSATPFNDIGNARKNTSFGDIVYLSGQFSAEDLSSGDCTDEAVQDIHGLLCLADGTRTGGPNNSASGASGLPIAYVGLPGSPATFTNSSTNTGDIAVFADHIVIAGLILTSSKSWNSIMTQSSDVRVVGNVLTNGGGVTVGAGTTHAKVFGNVASGNAFGGARLFGVDGNNAAKVSDVELAWNDIRNSQVACIALTTDGDGLDVDGVSQVSIHDNWLASDSNYGVGISTHMYAANDAGFSDLSIYDNVITDSSACIALDNANCDATNASDCVVHIWGNTCGYNNADGGAVQPPQPLLDVESLAGQWLDFDDNLFFFLPSSSAVGFAPFVDADSSYIVNSVPQPVAALPGDATFVGNFYGSTTSMSGPSWDLSAKTGNPIFHSAANDDYTLASFSTAVDSAAIVPVATDFRGVPRPQGKGYDSGAFEYCPGLDH